MKSDIHNECTTGEERYPKTHQDNLQILTKYTKPTITRNSESQRNFFAQKTGNGRNTQTQEKTYCKDKECYNCHKKFHPYSHCINKKKKNDNGDDKNDSSKESKTSIKNLYKDIKNANNPLTKLQANISDLKEEEYDLPESYGESHSY